MLIVITFVDIVVGGDLIVETLNAKMLPAVAGSLKTFWRDTVDANESQFNIYLRAVPEVFKQVTVEYKRGDCELDAG